MAQTDATVIVAPDGSAAATFHADTGLNVHVTNSLSLAAAADASVTGTTTYKNTALSGTKQQIKGSSGRIYGYHIYNPGVAVTYVQIFYLASASVTVGTTAADRILAIPAGAGVDTAFSVPITCASGITVAATTTSTGSTSPASALLANVDYA